MERKRHDLSNARKLEEFAPIVPASSARGRRRDKSQSRTIDRLQDAVYREMYLLESKTPGAEMGLALALLRAVIESEQLMNKEEARDWLQTICPICLHRIESALNESCACAPHPRPKIDSLGE